MKTTGNIRYGANRSRRRLLMPALCAMILISLPACSRKVQVQAPSSYETGQASWYGKKFQNKRTASGEKFDMNQFTAAHPTLPFNTIVRVENMKNGRKVEVRINDRGPFVKGRIIDLSRKAAEQLDMVRDGIVPVRIQVLN
ncbi:MAG: septal ring lytic transglycosylase RlpA family protein [Acidobacteriota bacterium]